MLLGGVTANPRLPAALLLNARVHSPAPPLCALGRQPPQTGLWTDEGLAAFKAAAPGAKVVLISC